MCESFHAMLRKLRRLARRTGVIFEFDPSAGKGALGGYVKRGWPIPAPGPARGRPTVELPPLVAAKLALYSAMRAQGVREAELGARLGAAEHVVRRLLDLDHRTHLDQVGASLRCLGKRLELRVRDAA